MKQFYHTTLICLLLSTFAHAQTFKPTSYWRAGSSGGDAIADIAIDSAGNQYICGSFTGTVDVDPGSGVYNISTASGQTQRDAFLLKLDVNGNFLWAKSFGGTTNDYQSSTTIKFDNNGNVYVLGLYRGNIRLTPSGTLWTTNSNISSPFIAKFTSGGNFEWGYGWFNSSQGYFWDVAFDDFNNLFVAGFFAGTFDFDPIQGSGNTNFRTSNGMVDMFIMKMSDDGNILKIRKAGGTGDDLFGTIEYDHNGNLLLSGSFSGTVDFDFSTNTFNLTSLGGRDGFVMKVDTALNFKWSKPFGGSGETLCRKMILTDSTMVNYGVFTQSMDLDPSTTGTTQKSSNGGFDCFIQVLDTSGNFLWAESFGGTGNEEAMTLALSQMGKLFTSGYFENTVDFDPSNSGSYVLSSSGGKDAFILELQGNGNFENAVKYGTNTPSGSIELAAVTSILNQPVAGVTFYNTIDINPSTLVTQNVTSAGQDDMLYLKLESCTNALAQFTDSVCGSQYTLPSGAVVTQSGYYLDTVLSSQGCDSTNGITVVLNPLPNTTITQTGATFSAQPGLSYQWLNCQTGQHIAGETNQTFTATTNGQYAVIVSNGTCTDTSTCITLDNIGLAEHNLPQVNLYPNPTSGLLYIQSAQPWQEVEVTDLLGRNLLTPPEPKTELDLSKLPTGIYLVKVFFAEGVVVQRVVKR